ncbi:MAG: hypothetical protein ACO24U_00930 [Prochlorococcaceae cyanobacterium]|jgi:hypothetical protein
MNWLFSWFKRGSAPDPESAGLVAEAKLKVDVQQRAEAIKQLHTGPRGGQYSIDAKGRKRYVKS